MKPTGDWSIDHPGQDNEPDLDRIAAEAEQAAWDCFMMAHPHEAYESNPERFWQDFHKKAPNMPRENMVALLKETE